MLNWMRFAAIFLLPALLFSAELETRLNPSAVRVGIPVRLELVSHSGDAPEFVKLPRITDLQWINGISRSTSVTASFSGIHRTVTTGYTFYVTAPGTYVIPSSAVRVGRKTLQSGEIRFTASQSRVPASSTSGARYGQRTRRSVRTQVSPKMEEGDSDLGKLLFLRITEPGPKKSYYLGEEIPVRIEAFFAVGLQASPSYPELRGSSGIVFRDYKQQNPENPRFDRVSQFRVEQGNRLFTRLDFRTRIRPVVPGPLSLEASMPVIVRVQDRSSRRSRDFFDDDFFDMSPFFSRTREIRHTLKGKSSVCEILPLPPPPSGSEFLGLTGKWTVTPALSAQQGRVGEAVTLSLELRGKGSAELLKAPVLAIPGFRVYPPEVEQRPDGALIRYVMIPAEPGQHAVHLSVSCFHPEKKQYEITTFDRTFTASPASGLVPSAGGSRVVDVSPASIREDSENPEEAPRHRQTSVLYLKKGPFAKVAVPYERNGRLFRILLLAAGILFWGICEILHHRKKRLEQDPMHHRKTAAAKARKALLESVRQTPESEISGLESRILSYVTDASGLPAGATLEEAASQVEKKDPELGRILRKLGVSAWAAPGSSVISREEKKSLLKGLSRLAVLVFAFLPAILSAASNEGEAMNAYDADRPEEAMYWYLSCQEDANPSPALLYNIGNTLFRQGKTAPALAAYEKARRLAPRDRDILENLNLVRRKLGLPEKNRVDTPAQLPAALRDQLRPDEWLNLSAFGIVILLCAIGLRHTFRKRVWLTLAALGVLLALVSFSEALWQSRTSYAENTAIITGPSPVLSALPSPTARRIPDVRLLPGEEVTVIEKRPGWTRIRAGNAEGWISGSELELLP